MPHSQLNRKEKEEHKKDNPALSKVIEKNIRTLIHLRTKTARERSLQEWKPSPKMYWLKSAACKKLNSAKGNRNAEFIPQPKGEIAKHIAIQNVPKLTKGNHV